MNDGFVEVTLARHWGDQPEGSVVHVDRDRANWLQENGYLAAPADESPRGRGRKKVKSDG